MHRFEKSLAFIIDSQVFLYQVSHGYRFIKTRKQESKTPLLLGSYVLGGGGGGGREKNRGAVITSLQLTFTEHIVSATQAFDWSLDNTC